MDASHYSKMRHKVDDLSRHRECASDAGAYLFVMGTGTFTTSVSAMWTTIVIMIGLSALIGVALGWRLKVFVLIPTIFLAAVSIAVIQTASGDQAWSVALTVVLVAAGLQISYLAGGIARAKFVKPVALENNTGDMALHIQKRMEVVGSDGEHVGTVDHTRPDRIVLTGDDPKAGGKPHFISAEWVDYVDSKVHLNKPSRKAVLEWRIAA
jgi:hypothetical protein